MNTKTTYLSAVIALSAFALGSCSEEDFPAISTDGVSKAVAESERFNLPFDDELSTRSSLNPTASPITFAWSEGDKLAVYSSATGMTNFELSSIDQNNSAIAKFRATGFNLKGGGKYYAFFPYNGNSTDKSSIPVDYEDITQSGNGTYDHLGVKDYQVASAQAEDSSEAANIHFKFHHLGAICRFRISGLPTDITYDRFSITAPGIITKDKIDITCEEYAINDTSTNKTTQTIKLGTDGVVADDGGTLTLYSMMAPTDLYGKGNVTLRLYTGKSDMSSVTLNVDGKKMSAGKAYGYSATYSTPEKKDHGWVDLGLTRTDGSRILFAKTNYGAEGETMLGTANSWSESDIVAANWGLYWRTPTYAEMWKLFNKQDNPQLSWEYDSDENGVWVINHFMEESDGEGEHRIFLPFKENTERGDYWCSTPTNSFWPELQLMEAADSNVGATGPKAYDFVTEMNSGNVVNSRIKIAQTAENFIRPIYIGPTSSASQQVGDNENEE